jgi:hypothetical protein
MTKDRHCEPRSGEAIQEIVRSTGLPRRSFAAPRNDSHADLAMTNLPSARAMTKNKKIYYMRKKWLI